jgi:isoquinoline 1-oxidoreductase alpha subunit
MIELTVNGAPRSVDVPPDTPLLWVLREELGLSGTKFGCGMALCGACTVHLDGEPIRACMTPIGECAGKRVLTIEGLGGDHPIQQAWVAENVPQCGYCQPGQVMSALGLLKKIQRPSDEQIDAVLSPNLCRCGTYVRIRRAVHRAAETMATGATSANGAEKK